MSLQDVLANIEATQQSLQQGAEEGLRVAAEQVLSIAESNAPIVTGELVSSGFIDLSDSEAAVGFSADHAAMVHENPNSSGFKFLENAIQQVDIQGIIEAHISRAIG